MQFQDEIEIMLDLIARVNSTHSYKLISVTNIYQYLLVFVNVYPFYYLDIRWVLNDRTFFYSV